MATVEKWTPFGVALDITATNGGVTRKSATQYTVKINASWEAYYEGAQTNYGMTASSGGGSATLNPFGTKASSGSGSFTGTYSISGNGSATKTITVTFKNFNNDNGDSATKTVSFDVTVPAWTSYTVSYNANGGSGAPSSQTKWKDQTLTLSSTKPTRTGYTFKGWALSKADADSGTWYYQAGGTCGKNENLTLYAVWEENILTINYYSNYATSAFEEALNAVGADKNVKVWTYDFHYDNDYSKYGLANYSNSSGSVYMTRTGYTGTGKWGTSTSGGTLIDEDTGYTTGQALAKALGKDLSGGNASINLYAQWKINTYTIAYNANGGTGNMASQSVNWDSTFTLADNTFSREGYKFVGWNLYRNADNKWYALGQGWYTTDEVVANGYSKKLYPNQDELTLDGSWIKNSESARTFTLYAIWEISGVVYIDNGTSFEPYLAYIDNGTDWDLYLAYVDDGTRWNIIS